MRVSGTHSKEVWKTTLFWERVGNILLPEMFVIEVMVVTVSGVNEVWKEKEREVKSRWKGLQKNVSEQSIKKVVEKEEKEKERDDKDVDANEVSKVSVWASE